MCNHKPEQNPFAFDTSERMKSLPSVLTEEYRMLDLLDEADLEQIKLDLNKQKQLLDESDRKERKTDSKIISKGDDEEEIAEAERNLFISRSKYRYRRLELLRKRLYEKHCSHRFPAALCFSGGGIRSATFCLGVLQALAKCGLLNQFHYLSTVSGGGYIGSWFTAWLYREGNFEKVKSALSKDRNYPFLFGLNDFRIDFTGALDEDLKNDLKNLKDNLERNRNFFQNEELNRLFDKIDCLVECEAGDEAIREFGKDLCCALNDIILNESDIAHEFEEEIKRQQEKESARQPRLPISSGCNDEERNSDDEKRRQRLKAKRQILETRLAGAINQLDEFEKVEPPQITYLRTYSNYLAPRTGLFSVDTWALVAIYLRNLLLNWTVSIPLIAALLLLPRLLLALLGSDLRFSSASFFWVAAIAGTVCVGLTYSMRPSLRLLSPIRQNYEIDDIGTVKSAGKKVFLFCLLPLLITAFCSVFYWVWVINNGNFSSPYLIGFTTDPVKQIGFIVFYLSILLAGVLFASVLFLVEKLRSDEEDLPRNKYVREFLAGLASGVLGGYLLYLFAYLLELFVNWVKDFDYWRSSNQNVWYLIFGVPLFLAAVLLSATFFAGLTSRISNDIDREWLSRFAALVMITAVGWIVFTFIVLLGPEIYQVQFWESLFLKKEDSNFYKIVSAIVGTISGLITLLLGFSSKSPADGEKESKTWTGALIKFLPQIAAPVFALLLAATLSYLIYLLLRYFNAGFNEQILSNRAPANSLDANVFVGYLFIWLLIFVGIGTFMGFFINVNKFSLHALYRERLIRAYLGASRAEKRLQTANSFSDLDEADNVEMYRLKMQKPFHVVNMTLNLGKATNLRWQNRKAESFTATALHCGSSNMGDGSGCYRNSVHYGRGGIDGNAITLGTVTAVSGAAVSPNMGYYTQSAPVSLLMALFNVRLGWWLGNPGKRGAKHFKKSAPTFAPFLYKDEALNGTTDTNPYVYLSDGGHFDNLGLYEMVLRRCRLIVACDAGADLKYGFSDLGTAIHKIRVDLGVPIEFVENQSPVEGRNCAIARIAYSEIDKTDSENDGYLIYIKPTLDGDEPIDIVNYKSISPDFPHETTGDQFFNETQFESYRTLAVHMINSICSAGGAENPPDLKGFLDNAKKYLKRFENQKETNELNQIQTPGWLLQALFGIRRRR